MADPLSVSASIAGLVSLAESIIKLTYRYGVAVHHAEAEIKALGSEVAGLYGVLCAVHFVAKQLEDGAGLHATKVEHVRGCFDTLENVQQVLSKHAPPLGEEQDFKRWKRRLLYPFSKTEVQDWIRDIERWKSTMTLTLSADSMVKLEELLSSQQAMAADVREVRLALQKTEANKIERKMNVDRKRLLDSLEVAARRNVYDLSCSTRCPGTGTFLLRDDPDYQEWLKNSHSILWLKGIVGSGKTILVSAMVSELETRKDVGTGLAYFFCTYADPASQHPQKILACLVKQLAEQSETAFDQLIVFFERFRSHVNRHEFLPVKVWEQLLLEMCGSFQDVLIVVDGIEECDKSALEVVDALCTIKESCRDQVALVISSRSEEHFRPRIREHLSITIAAANDDLRLYVWTEVTQRSNKGLLHMDDVLRDELCNRLIEKANGMFQWVACQIEFLCQLQTAKEQREALDTLPATLKETYDRILSKLIDNKPASVRVRIQRTLRFINWTCVTSHLQRFDHHSDEYIQGPYIPFSGSGLCEAVSIEQGLGTSHLLTRDAVPSLEDILRCCGSLIHKSKIGRGDIGFSHFTVKEYLTQLSSHRDTQLAEYAVTSDPQLAYAELVELSLNYLQLDDFNDERPTQKLSDISLELEHRDPSFAGDPFAFRETAIRSIWQTTPAFHALVESNDNTLILATQLLQGDAFPSFAQYTWLLYRYSFTVQRKYREDKAKQIRSLWEVPSPIDFAIMIRSPKLFQSLDPQDHGFLQSRSIDDIIFCIVWGRLTLPVIAMLEAHDNTDEIIGDHGDEQAKMIDWIFDFVDENGLGINDGNFCWPDIAQTGDLAILALIIRRSKPFLTWDIIEMVIRCVQIGTEKNIGSAELHLSALRDVFVALTQSCTDYEHEDSDLVSCLSAAHQFLKSSTSIQSAERAAIDKHLFEYLVRENAFSSNDTREGTQEPRELLLGSAEW